MLQKQEARMLQYRQGEDAERLVAGKQGAASVSTASKPAVVQLLPSSVQTAAVTYDLKEVAEAGQGEGTGDKAPVDKRLSKAEKARLDRESAHRRKAKAKEAKAAARAADATAVATADAPADAPADTIDEKVADQAAGSQVDEVDNKQEAEREGHLSPAEQGSTQDDHAVGDPRQAKDADAFKYLVEEQAGHTASMDDSNGSSAVLDLGGDEPMPYAVMAAGSVFVAGIVVMGAWCAAVTSPVWVPRVAWKCTKAAWSWRPKNSSS